MVNILQSMQANGCIAQFLKPVFVVNRKLSKRVWFMLRNGKYDLYHTMLLQKVSWSVHACKGSSTGKVNGGIPVLSRNNGDS
eukprot:m.238030 g.238030  ORF g.238030 m.238030 type:complete len:82 (+) comp17422_c0_seq4:4659-4904(+)